MSITETVNLMSATGKMAPRYLRRRAGEDKRARPPKKAPIKMFDPLAATAGVSSHYYRERVAGERAVAASVVAALAAKMPPQAPSNPGETVANVDDLTVELRRRLCDSQAAAPRRLSRPAAWLIAAALSVVLWFGVAGLIFTL